MPYIIVDQYEDHRRKHALNNHNHYDDSVSPFSDLWFLFVVLLFHDWDFFHPMLILKQNKQRQQFKIQNWVENEDCKCNELEIVDKDENILQYSAFHFSLLNLNTAQSFICKNEN